MSFSIAMRRPNRAELIEHLLPLAICFGFALLIVSTASTLILQAGFLDPYVYAGYVNDYFGTYHRYGHTYYSSRIAYILLDRAFLLVFGQTNGLFLCRLLVLTSAAYAAFRIAQRYFGFATAVLTISWLCFIPWLLRSISWTHYDGFATVYFLVALAFILVPQRHRVPAYVIAGFSLALAVNCNLHLLMIAGLFVPSWFWMNRKIGVLPAIRLTLAIIFGFIAGYAMLQVLFSLATGTSRVFIEAAAFNSARTLLGGQMSNWFHSLSNIIAIGNLIFLLPIFFCVAVILATALNRSALQQEQRDFCIGAALYITLLTTAVFGLHFMGHGWLSLFYYVVYLLPGCLLALIAIAGIASTRTPTIFRVICIGTAVGLAGLWFARQAMPPTIPNDIRIWIALAAITVVLALLRPRITSAPALLAGLIVSTTLMFYWQPRVIIQYASWPGLKENAELEKDVYAGAVFLQKFVRTHVPTPTAIGFWYSNAPENVNLNSMQSMFLWGYSRVQGFTGPGMPVIDDAVRQSVHQKPFIGVIARNDKELDEAFAALKSIPANFTEIARAYYTAPVESYVIAIVELAPVASPIGARIGELALYPIMPQNGGAIGIASNGIALTMPACQWCYGATALLSPEHIEGLQHIIMRVTLTVSEGQIGIATATSDNISALQNPVSVGVRAIDQTVDIRLPIPAKNPTLVFRNESPNGISRATVRSIEYYKEN